MRLIIGRTTNNELIPVMVDDNGHLQIDLLSAVPVDIASIPPVDIATLPSLPAGANNIGKVDVNSLPSLPAGANNIGKVDVNSLPSLPAGANNIGKVDVNSLPSLPAGLNNIGDVDIVTMPRVAIDPASSLPAGLNNIGDVDIVTLPSLPAGSNQIGSIGLEGYFGGNWFKAPIPFGVSALFNANKVNASLPAGASNQDFGALLANRIYVLKNWTVAYTGTVAGVTLTVVMVVGGIEYVLETFTGLVSGRYYTLAAHDLVIDSTVTLRVKVAGATLNDDLNSYVTGYWYATNL